jgi:hypothetical protein
VQPSVWKAIKASIALAAAVNIGWLIAASYDHLPPLSSWASVGIVTLSPSLALTGIENELQKQEKQNGGSSGFWGPYRRAMLRGVLLGSALAATYFWYAEYSGKLERSLLNITILFVMFGASGIFAEVVQCAGRLRDRPFLAGLDDFVSGAILGLCLSVVSYAIAVRSLALAGTTESLMVCLGTSMVVCGVVNVWRKNGTSAISFLDSFGEFSIEVGGVFTRLVAFTKSCLWLGLAVFIAWLTLVAFPDWALAKACGFGAAVLAGLVGLRELGPVLRVRDTVRQQVHGRADKAKEANALSAASGTVEKPPWVNHGYRD